LLVFVLTWFSWADSASYGSRGGEEGKHVKTGVCERDEWLVGEWGGVSPGDVSWFDRASSSKMHKRTVAERKQRKSISSKDNLE